MIVGYGLIPLLMRQPVTSAYEILESRLGTSIRLAGAGVFLLLRFGWMATILFATARVVLVPLLGIDPWWTPWLCVALGVVTAMYSSWGGIKAVVMTDAIQSITMLAGAVVTLAVITVRMGGVAGWWPQRVAQSLADAELGIRPGAAGVVRDSAALHDAVVRLHEWLGPDVDPAIPVDSRCVGGPEDAWPSSQITDVVVSLLLALTGVAILGFYRAHPPEFADWQTLRSVGDQLFPKFIMTEMPAGLSGLVLAAILSAAMSSLSSGVNSACAVLDRDFLSRRSETRRRKRPR